ncbi:MAG: PDZ domain-containing protein [Nanoarchaeota archaeon]|nr:PDZ domain-containing protein [Nanoarchaeota archaeon]
MGYLKYARHVIVLLLVVWLFFVIHPFTREGVIVTNVEAPASLVIKEGDLLQSINGYEIKTIDDFHNAISQIKPNDTVKVTVLRETFPYSYTEITHVYVAGEKNNRTNIHLAVKETQFSKLKLSYKLSGGNKYIISTNQTDAIEIIKERLKLNRIYDFSIYEEDGKIILLTTAGDEVIPIIETKGEFYAKIGNNTFFTVKDIKSICTTGVNCNLYTYQHYNESNPNERNIVWKYGFEVDISKEAGERFANLTKDLSIASCKYDKCMLNETIDYYIDGKKIGSEPIYAESKGLPYEKVTVGGDVKTKEDAMKMLYFTQSILKTGELNAKVESVEKYSAPKSILLSSFIYILIAIIIATIAISFLLLKKIKVAILAGVLGASELVIVIGIVAGLNIIVTPGVLLSIIFTALIMLGIYSFISYKFKKEGIIKSKIMEISKEINKWEIIALVVLTIAIVFAPSLVAPIMVYVATNITLTKPIILKVIEKSK